MDKMPSKEEQVEEKVIDPLVERLMELADENLAAFTISCEGYDNVSNIATKWDYGMVRECIIFIETKREMQERDYKKQERNQ